MNDDFEPEAVVEAYGGRVHVVPGSEVDPQLRESLLVESDGSFVITIPAHTPRTRDRFTIAHELGHYLLHWKLSVRNGETASAAAFSRAGLDPAEEYEANAFAAALLMPANAFEEALRESDVLRVAERFGVSSAAALFRMANLGIDPK